MVDVPSPAKGRIAMGANAKASGEKEKLRFWVFSMKATEATAG